MKTRADLLMDGAWTLPGAYSMVAFGKIYNDEKSRWPEGTDVTTSRIVSLSMEDGYVLLHTLNTVYRVITEEDVQP